VELATFRNPQGLQALGGNVWANTFASGDPVVGVPGEGNMGVLQAGNRGLARKRWTLSGEGAVKGPVV
jgi:flagellar basal body rod protein FlgG